jgi:secondary thiamine-phosphate synthase enzyme
MDEFTVRTRARFEMIDITKEINSVVRKSGVESGLCSVYTLHTTAAVTINEKADPDVPKDILMELDKVVPLNDGYRHIEGNSAAHIKASLIGPSEVILVAGGALVLGTWQSVFFCEFDGPRTRKIVVACIADRS